MPAYHSAIPADATPVVGNFALLPLRSKFRGPAYPPGRSDEEDIVDETLTLFRANCFFRNFEIKSPSDRTLIYGILFISEALNRLSHTMDEKEAGKVLNTLALEHFAIPGDPGFPLNSLYARPRDRTEVEALRSWLSQFRQELALRLTQRLYAEDKSAPSKVSSPLDARLSLFLLIYKWWMGFTRRKFMNKSLS